MPLAIPGAPVKLQFCVACGTTSDLQHHHLVMRSEGGSDAETNLITLCTACHHKMPERQMHGIYSHSELTKPAKPPPLAGRKPAVLRLRE